MGDRAIPTLLLTTKDGSEKIYPIDCDELTIGRELSNSVSIKDDPGISRFHARVVCYLELFWIEDLNSKNGTYYRPVNGKRKRLIPEQPVLLEEGSEIRLGQNTLLRVHGLVISPAEITQRIYLGLQRLQDDLDAARPDMPPEKVRRFRQALEDFRQQAGEAKGERELSLLAAQTIQTIAADLNADAPDGQKRRILPDIPSDLPSPSQDYTIRTVLKTFFDNLDHCFPDESDPDQSLAKGKYKR